MLYALKIDNVGYRGTSFQGEGVLRLCSVKIAPLNHYLWSEFVNVFDCKSLEQKALPSAKL